MASQAKQKQKLLYLKKLFERRSDEEHPITGIQLIDILSHQNIKCERKTVYDDIDTLKESGMDIVTTKVGHSNAYFLGERLFQDEELLVLVDSVASSRFLTKKKSRELIDKLKSLTSEYKADNLNREFFIRNRSKTVNKQIYYNINAINEGILKEKNIEFKYFEYTADKKQQLRHGGEVYKVSPYYFVYNDNNYYLICYNYKRSELSYFRIDRMTAVNVTEEDRYKLSDEEKALAGEQRYAVFEMFPGKPETVEIKFENSLMNAVIDRFSERVVTRRADDDHFIITVDVQLSPTFYGWIFKFAEKAEILSPQSAVDEAKRMVESISKIYSK
ncbi:WYL domain-containing protein [Ruminococcus sp. NK3A76]|uniref:helix-turn-helix transcriptional regulator n=1 Tax=Ruminococcus sp. NK3A76 TaxID=877411 RepID=UPI00048B5897|nr:WYL domain-containing protein [Ruminococcus sp. NK3A76]